MLVYHLGVLRRLRSANMPIQCYAGSSGGAIAACVGACVDDLEGFVTKYALNGASRQGLEDMLPADAHKQAASRLAVSVTESTTGANVLISDFPSRDALLKAVWASCHLPTSFHPLEFFTLRKPPSPPRSRVTYHASEGMPLEDFPGLDLTYLDGGLSANIPVIPGLENLRVSVLGGPKEKMLICRQDTTTRLPGSVYMSGLKVYLSIGNLHAGMAALGGKRSTLEHYCDQGMADCDAFLENLSDGT